MTTTQQYDYLNRLLSVSSSPSSSIPTPISYSYTYNTASRRVTQTRTDATVVNYAYDYIGQLTGATGTGTENITYAYDNAWNASSKVSGGTTTTFNVDVENQLTTVGADTFNYDTAGNLLYMGSSAGTKRNFAYDDENQLTTVTVPGSYNGQFTYDGRGRLRARKDYTWSNPTVTPLVTAVPTLGVLRRD